jgi:threonine/homoserine/homoserine lactone efflux protein
MTRRPLIGCEPVLSELIPLALVIALSPLSIIPAVLVLRAPHPRPAGLAFLVGWVLGLAVLTQVFVELSSLLGGGLNKPPQWAPYVRIVVGAALIAFGVYKWVTRKRAEHTPKWMSGFSSITPRRAFVTAVVLVAVNPKVLFMCLAAGLAIGTEGLGRVGAVLGLVYFVVLAASTVLVPILAYAVSGDRLDPTLAKVKDWMEAQHAVLIAVILVVLGVMVLYKGIHGL